MIEVLKSRGKLGGAGLMVLGLGIMAYSYFKGAAQYQEGATVFFIGLGIVGIRGKQDK